MCVLQHGWTKRLSLSCPLVVIQRKGKDGSRMEVTCPDSVILYGKHNGGVDRGDQNTTNAGLNQENFRVLGFLGALFRSPSTGKREMWQFSRQVAR